MGMGVRVDVRVRVKGKGGSLNQDLYGRKLVAGWQGLPCSNFFPYNSYQYFSEFKLMPNVTPYTAELRLSRSALFSCSWHFW